MFGVRLQVIRTALGLSQQDLADKVGLTRTSITNIEAGKQRILLGDVERFANAFGVSPKHLLRGMWT
jgi:transcriptional regulator with XRE-family HTH domain